MSKGAVKTHTVIDLCGSTPVFIHITDGRWHDSNVMDLLEVMKRIFYCLADICDIEFRKLINDAI